MSNLTKKQLIDKNGVHTTRNVKDEATTTASRLRNVAPTNSARPITDVRSGDEIALSRFQLAVEERADSLRHSISFVKNPEVISILSLELQNTMLALNSFDELRREKGGLKEARDYFIANVEPMVESGSESDPRINGYQNVLIEARKISYDNSIIDLRPSTEEAAWFSDDPNNTFNRFENFLNDTAIGYASIYSGVSYRDDDDPDKSDIVDKMDNLDRIRRTWAHVVNEASSLSESKRAMTAILAEGLSIDKPGSNGNPTRTVLDNLHILEPEK